MQYSAEDPQISDDESLDSDTKPKIEPLEFTDSDQEDKEGLDTSEDDDLEFDKNGEIDYSSRVYKPSPEEYKKLKNMQITLRHNVPEQHTIGKMAGTRALSDAEKESFEMHAKLKSGYFNETEDLILKNNWKRFCKIHKWDSKNPKPFLYMKHEKSKFFLTLSNRLKFVQFLANGLPNRSLYSVYNRFKILYHPHKTSRYTQSEDTIILNFMRSANKTNSNRMFAELALILKRTRASVWRRHRILKKKYLNGLKN